MILEFTFFNTNNIFLFKLFGHRPSRFIPETVTFVNYYLELLFYFFYFLVILCQVYHLHWLFHFKSELR